MDFYSLVGTSPDLPSSRPGMNAPVIDLKSVGVQTFFDPGGSSCDGVDSFVYAIAISTWERHTSAAVPGQLGVDVDTNHDGTPDYFVYGAPASGASLADVTMYTWVYDYESGLSSAWWYADNSTNDSNTVLWFCGDQVGTSAANLGDPWTLDVYATDWYFSGNDTDSIKGIEVAPGGERWGTDEGYLDLAGGDPGQITVVDWSHFYSYEANVSESGLLILTNGNRGSTSGAAPKGNENIQVLIDPLT